MAPEQLDWLKLPLDLLEPIAQRSRDAVAGLAAFRSVCRTWRAAVTQTAAPRLLLPRVLLSHNGVEAERRGGSNNKYELPFPLSRGWFIVVDVRDVSCHLKHLPTGATAALPKVNAVRDSVTSPITHLGFEYAPDDDHEDEAPFPDKDRDQETPSLDDCSAYGDDTNDDDAPCPEDNSDHPDDNDEYQEPCPEDNSEPEPDDDDEHSDGSASVDDWYRRYMFKIEFGVVGLHFLMGTYLSFSDVFNFAIHVPPGTPAASTDGMVIMMYHLQHGRTGMVFCRPGDTAWTKIDHPNPLSFIFTDFAYFQGKMLALDMKGVTLVFDATTLQLMYQIDLPPGTSNVASQFTDEGFSPSEFHYLRLIALPTKVILVRTTCVRSSEPGSKVILEGFHIFELSSGLGEDGGGGHACWRKVTRGDIGGSYELFLDCYHATFRDARDGRGTRIFFHHDFSSPVGHSDFFSPVGTAAAYCYSMEDDKLECVYMPSEEDDDDDGGMEYSTRATWFVPTN